MELETRSIGRCGEPTLASAYDLLLAVWRNGCRGREIGLHLMFLAWYLLCEPRHITGFDESESGASALTDIFREVHECFRPFIRSDAEMLYVVGLMTHQFPYHLGDESELTQLSQEYRTLYRSLAPEWIRPDIFSKRGAYGDYFAGQSQVIGGY